MNIKLLLICLYFLFFQIAGVIMRAEGITGSPITASGLMPTEGLVALISGLFLIPVVFIAIYAIPRILKFLRHLKEKGLIQEMTAEAEKNEAAGKFVSAALIYEGLKNTEKAALLYEKGGDFVRAAAIYESAGDMIKAKELYEKSGDLDKAAETSMSAGDFVEAAKIYDRHGDKLKAAQALEMTGNRLAAVRAYREAKDYVKAAMLLEEEGLYKEASEMYKISLVGKVFGTSTIEMYYTFATLLEKAGDKEKACGIFREISRVSPEYMDVPERLKALCETAAPGRSEVEKPPAPEFRETAVRRTSTLRNIMQTGRMEPRYSFRFWVQILKELDRRYKQGSIPEHFSPDSISVDGDNNIDFDKLAARDFSYISPEVVHGESSDQISAIYSLGIILYEMITGSLDSVGIKSPREVSSDIPEWLEELTLRCIDRNRAGRFQSLEEIFSTLLALKNRM